MGAGCSHEEPTALPLSGDLSRRCFRKLVDDQVLQLEDVANPYDLSAVAEAVFEKRLSQRELVERFPPGDFSQAEPNDGYLVMAALFLEGAIADALTLNFDHAARAALSGLGAGNQVTTIKGPDEHRRLSNRNLIYLHRDIDSQPDDLILRTSQLDQAWQEGWEQVVAQRVLAGSTIIFVGLGSPPSVLVKTMNRIVNALPDDQTSVFVVDTAAYADSTTAHELDIEEAAYLRMGWGEFMRALGDRVVAAQCGELQQVCEAMANELGVDSEDVSSLCDRLASIGLVGLGQLRAAWMLNRSSYRANLDSDSLQQIGNILMVIRLMERTSGSSARFFKEGLIEFSRDGKITRMVACSGSGWRNYTSIQGGLNWHLRKLGIEGREPSVAVVAGMASGPEVTTPDDITGEAYDGDVIIGPESLTIIDVNEVRLRPERVKEIIQ